MQSAIDIRAVSKSHRFRGREQQALATVSASFSPGDSVAVTGPSGAGKSTLLNILALMERPSHGTVRLWGQDAGALSASRRARMRNELVGFVPQNLHLMPGASVERNVSLPLDYASRRPDDAAGLTRALLGRVGLHRLAHHRVDDLSGGQRQRVAVCRALIMEPLLVLADEPTSALDEDNAQIVIDALLDAPERGGITMVATHDERIIRRCRKVLDLGDDLPE